MPKNKKNIGYNAVFPTRLRMLLKVARENDVKITQQELADAVGVTRQAVGQWCIGNTVPDILCLKKIAELFDVSSDYLIGVNAKPIKCDCGNKINLTAALNLIQKMVANYPEGSAERWAVGMISELLKSA